MVLRTCQPSGVALLANLLHCHPAYPDVLRRLTDGGGLVVGGEVILPQLRPFHRPVDYYWMILHTFYPLPHGPDYLPQPCALYQHYTLTLPRTPPLPYYACPLLHTTTLCCCYGCWFTYVQTHVVVVLC